MNNSTRSIDSSKLTNPHYKKPQTYKQDVGGKPLYLTRVPFYKKYQAQLVLGISFLAGIGFWAPQIYQALFYGPEDIKDKSNWWPAEIRAGKRYHEQYREKKLLELEAKAMKAKLEAEDTSKSS